MPYKRSERQFFHQPATLESLVELSQVDHLVVMVGAGGTIDRTGLNWGDNVVGLFEKPGQRTLPSRPSVAEARALLGAMGPLALTSVLTEFDLLHEGDEEKLRANTANRLRLALYGNSDWQAGRLLPNLVRLVVACITTGKTVTVITSNQDTHIEDEFLSYIKELHTFQRAVPGLKVTAFGDKAGQDEPILIEPPQGGVGSLDLYYQHGRVPLLGEPRGFIPLSENDYYDHFEPLVEELSARLSTPDSGLLCLGSSLTDLPQVAALSRSRQHSHRVALVPAHSSSLLTGELDHGRLLQQYQRRGKHLEVALLLPDFHFQVAQYCEELRIAITNTPGGARGYADPDTRARYGLRLLEWWEHAQQLETKTGLAKIHDRLTRCLTEIKEVLPEKESADGPESMRVELWIRSNPRKDRHLAFIGKSGELITDTTGMRFAELELGTHNAAVAAFIEGRPQIYTWDDLRKGPARPDEDADNSRWKTFLPVPLRASSPLGSVPVGVITLASTRPQEQSRIPDGDAGRMSELVKILRKHGDKLIDFA